MTRPAGWVSPEPPAPEWDEFDCGRFAELVLAAHAIADAIGAD